jgi:hypothetical protein
MQQKSISAIVIEQSEKADMYEINVLQQSTRGRALNKIVDLVIADNKKAAMTEWINLRIGAAEFFYLLMRTYMPDTDFDRVASFFLTCYKIAH